MGHTIIRGEIHSDNTGVATEIPVLVTEHGPLIPLVEYFKERAEVRSQNWMTKLAQAVGLLIEYMDANHDCFKDTKDLFTTFVLRLSSGTVDKDGMDPSGLYWSGRNPALVRQLVSQLSEFSDWMAKQQGTEPLNPWRQATRSEERLAWAAWYHKRDRAFLAHTWSQGDSGHAMTRARNILLQKTPVIDHETVKFFPENHVMDLLFKGFIVPGKQKSPRMEERLNLRDILITLLMHYGGLRISEPFHLYVQDVQPDPLHPARAWVRVFHPSLGVAPPDWLDPKAKPIRCNRQRYLQGQYGLKPRDDYHVTSQLHAGWKNNALNDKANYMDVHWFPGWAGELFLKLWVLYMAQRARLVCDHPFAFVTLKGHPYAIDSFEQQHRRAVERIGLVSAKALGTSPHGHRHAYGQALADAGIDPVVRKKALHHKSLESQVVYTEPNRSKVCLAMDAALQREKDGGISPPPDFLAYGFQDVDPLGLLSGLNPKLRRSK
ncbi:MAG: site-specific integrase [Burkholderiaceae bacterium]|nr:site-specific integrase [Burkholderiaceae bacterium]